MRRGEVSITHGHKRWYKRTRVYVSWMNMKARCRNPRNTSFHDYGGRGISYEESWEFFENFLADMGEPPEGMTLERRDNSLGYSKDNCMWASRAVQNLNKRNCVRYELNGEVKTLSEWARDTGIGRVTILKRLQRGVPLEVALTARGYLCATRGSNMHRLA